MRSGRKFPLEARHRHFVSETWQLSLPDWLMQVFTQVGKIWTSCDDAKGRLKMRRVAANVATLKFEFFMVREKPSLHAQVLVGQLFSTGVQQN